VGHLVKELSLHRSRIYEAINRLADKGLVSNVIRNNVKYFESADPENLLSYLEEKKEHLNEAENNIKKIIPELRAEISPLKPHAEAHILLGKEGFKTMRNDVLRNADELLLIGGKGKEYTELKYYFANFDRDRVKKKIKWKILVDYTARAIKANKKLQLTEVKYLPKGYSTPTVINVYSDRVVTVLWQDNIPLCFMIINKAVADSYRKWFQLLWKFSSD